MRPCVCGRKQKEQRLDLCSHPARPVPRRSAGLDHAGVVNQYGAFMRGRDTSERGAPCQRASCPDTTPAALVIDQKVPTNGMMPKLIARTPRTKPTRTRARAPSTRRGVTAQASAAAEGPSMARGATRGGSSAAQICAIRRRRRSGRTDRTTIGRSFDGSAKERPLASHTRSLVGRTAQKSSVTSRRGSPLRLASLLSQPRRMARQVRRPGR